MAEVSEIEAGGEVRTIKDATARNGVAANADAIAAINAKIPASASASNKMTTAEDLAAKQDKIENLGAIYTGVTAFQNLSSGTPQQHYVNMELPKGSYILFANVLFSTSLQGKTRMYIAFNVESDIFMPLNPLSFIGKDEGQNVTMHDSMPITLQNPSQRFNMTLSQWDGSTVSGTVKFYAIKVA